jgi:transforming growth factor-beta-induced protein
MVSAIALPFRSGVSRLSFALVLLASLLASLLTAVPAPARAQDTSADIVDTAVEAGSFTTLATALEAAGLADTLKGPGPFTVFAPTDEAFAELPVGTVEGLLANPDQLRAVLTYHVVPGRVTAADVLALTAATTVQGENVAVSAQGGGVRINDANVIQADIMASNGVIHVLDSVILPPSMTAMTAQPGPAPATGASVDIVDTAVAAGSFSTLATALDAAGLVETLKGPGPFTVFAPTDEAFAKLPAGTLEGLLGNPDALRSVLTYHVVSGRVTAADAVTLPAATTVQGEDVTIINSEGGVQINDATVTVADLMASNGIIHVIDSVILPPSLAAGSAGH